MVSLPGAGYPLRPGKDQDGSTAPRMLPVPFQEAPLHYAAPVAPAAIRHGVAMKSGLLFLVKGYIGVGALFSFAIGISYIFSTYYVIWNFGWGIFSFAGFMALMISVGMAIISSLLRAIFWLPSLILWFLSDQDNFWLWLAPGFFVTSG
jgi:hypothetical protein